ALAKAGKLRAVVATTGLGAGVNFSMRSVIISGREYEAEGKTKALRPDELLQMYGRAGRRGLDKLGYAICLPSKPRLSDAREIFLARADFLDWSAFIRVMQRAIESGKDHIKAAKNLAERLFWQEKIDLGFEAAKRAGALGKENSDGVKIEMKNSQGLWQRRTPTSNCRLENTLFFDGEKWVDFLESKRALSLLKIGAVCALPSGNFGLKVRIASKTGENLFRLNKSIIKKLGKKIPPEDRAILGEKGATIKTLRRRFLKYIPRIFAGAQAEILFAENDALFALLNAKGCAAKTYKDAYGKNLFNPPMREVLVKDAYNFEALSGIKKAAAGAAGPAQMWRKFGLVDEDFRPTMRGRIFSLFDSGEGLAIAAALEDESIKIGEIFYDLANLRAGERFERSSKIRSSSSRLADICRIKYGICDVRGYLKKGVPPDYGEGASEIMRKLEGGAGCAELEDEILRRGDIERARLEWQSLINRIASCPELENERFLLLRSLAQSKASEK
ncbi:MAG: hypothetical protein IKO42_00570, partial [Opitutales bacterium]|nr:hypothetical protein [Opitutales bacterium]